MSQIAKRSGIGRATLYKYFPDIESILAAWHERHITAHLRHLADVSEAADPAGRLAAVLRAYAAHSRERTDGGDLTSLLHVGEHATRAHAHLHEFITTLIREAAGRGEARGDVPAGELASYCLHALTAANGLASADAAGRLVDVTLDGLGPGPGAAPAALAAALRAEQVSQQGDLGSVVQDLLVHPPDDVDEDLLGVTAVGILLWHGPRDCGSGGIHGRHAGC